MDGYQVGHKGMSGQAGELDGSGDDVGKIRKAITNAMCYPQDTLGGCDTGPAFEAFSAAWEAETKVLEAALHELADKIRLSSQAYRDPDIDVRRGTSSIAVDSAGERGDAAGKSDEGISTMPVYAQRPSALGSY
ncbi:hypothetical protein ABZ532_06530 [Streptomyces sp. NPDC019396]|uniref:hypothetical protein n=1 Tax=Streptomyces sp. NPDC019396 TaxID=3154687 RepID=UPI0033E6BA3C